MIENPRKYDPSSLENPMPGSPIFPKVRTHLTNPPNQKGAGGGSALPLQFFPKRTFGSVARWARQGAGNLVGGCGGRNWVGILVAERIEGRDRVRLKGNDETESLRPPELATNRQKNKNYYYS